jgi:Flp pilus assembly CpaE family ATPase
LLFFNPTENFGSFQVRVSAAFSESAAAAATEVAEAEALNATVLGAKLGVGSINLTHPTATAIKATTTTDFNPIFIHQYFRLFN